MQQADRILTLEGARNVRALGGFYTLDGRLTRWRTLYRSDSSHRFKPAAQEQLLALGLKTVIDLRESDEIETKPSVFFASSEVSYCSRPFWGQSLPEGSGPDIQLGYIRELDECGQRRSAVSWRRPTLCRRSCTARLAKTAPACSSRCCWQPRGCRDRPSSTTTS